MYPSLESYVNVVPRVVVGGSSGASLVGGGGGVTLVDTKILNSNTFIIFITFPSHAGACKVHIAISM